MYRLKMIIARRIMLFAAVAMCCIGLASCGSDGAIESAVTSSAADASDEQAEASNVADDDEDHGDEDHEDHDDEDHEDHGDEDHEDHGDEDHDDEDHEDHDDEDHDDEDHEDHGDEDHGDDDHEDHDDHEDESSSGLGAHVHGEAELSVAWSDDDMVIDFISPTESIFGFEYEPTTDEDIALADERTQTLIAPGLLAINAEAGCDLTGDPVTDVVFEGSHAEITASWFFTCENPDQIAELDAAELFAEFPGLVEIDAQWASADLQSAAELSASSTVLRFG